MKATSPEAKLRLEANLGAMIMVKRAAITAT
jgi:hypothetical protein